ncbi:hypothetical protein [Micromonospora sp. DPT]|uniref:hypothetical protein n=1 Tax=Micromonospora sp. DPT TaxID=3142975 RepID=UPI0032087FDD
MERDVILFDNRGIGATVGVTPSTIEQMADDAAAERRALGLLTPASVKSADESHQLKAALERKGVSARRHSLSGG